MAQRQWEFPRKVVAIIDDVVICIYIYVLNHIKTQFLGLVVALVGITLQSPRQFGPPDSEGPPQHHWIPFEYLGTPDP